MVFTFHYAAYDHLKSADTLFSKRVIFRMKAATAPLPLKWYESSGYRYKTFLSGLESCASSVFHYEDPVVCLLSIHQRLWIGWAVTAARKPQYRANAIILNMQIVWSWIVRNREPLRLTEPCVAGKNSHFHSAEKQCSKWLWYCSRHCFLWLVRNWSFAASLREKQSTVQNQCQSCMNFSLVFLVCESSKGI